MCHECSCYCRHPGDWDNCGYHQAVMERCPWCKVRVRVDGNHYEICGVRHRDTLNTIVTRSAT